MIASQERGRRVARELAFVCTFVALTALMTWPWVRHLRNGVADDGDSYLNAWTMWWDFHQTFRDPLHLFNANIFYPYADTLAFSEHDYGIALVFFPLFALGAGPLTVVSVATLVAIASSGYAAFRLARTMTGSAGAGVVAGIAFAFVPFRFMHLTHVNYMFTPWIPLTLEAVVLLARRPSRARAVWLGAAFLMNGLTCVHWFVLTLLPLAAAAVISGARSAEPRTFVRRAFAAVSAALVLLVPFLIPYARVANRFGFVREAGEARYYSADWIHWLTPPDSLHAWRAVHVGDASYPWEKCLFPGLLTCLLAAAAVCLWRRPDRPPEGAARAASPPPRFVLRFLDVAAAAALVVATLASGTKPLRLSWGPHVLLRASEPDRALALLVLLLLARWSIAWPEWFFWVRQPNLRASLRHPMRPDGVAIGLTWVVLGVLGSLGMHFPFHRILFASVPLFRSIRVPARWAVVADVGLALLAGAGALALLSRFRARSAPRLAGFALLSGLLLWELRVAPVYSRAGEEPDESAKWLRDTPMRGGIVELPTDDVHLNLWVLRAATHQKPLVDATSGFRPPVSVAIERFTNRRPVPRGLATYLEAIPVSYLVVHEDGFAPEKREAMRDFLSWALASGRLRFVRRFTDRGVADVFAVARTEPAASGTRRRPWAAPPDTSHDDPTLTGAVDGPREEETVTGPLTVRGWAQIPGEDLSVTLLIDGEERPPAAFTRTERPDVCGPVPGLVNCSRAGYEATFPFEPGDAGRHEIVAVFRTRDGRTRHYPTRHFAWQPPAPP